MNYWDFDQDYLFDPMSLLIVFEDAPSGHINAGIRDDSLQK